MIFFMFSCFVFTDSFIRQIFFSQGQPALFVFLARLRMSIKKQVTSFLYKRISFTL